MDEILRTSAAPGYSEHHTGRCVDFTTPGCTAPEEAFERSSAFRWLQRNASAETATASRTSLGTGAGGPCRHPMRITAENHYGAAQEGTPAAGIVPPHCGRSDAVLLICILDGEARARATLFTYRNILKI